MIAAGHGAMQTQTTLRRIGRDLLLSNATAVQVIDSLRLSISCRWARIRLMNMQKIPKAVQGIVKAENPIEVLPSGRLRSKYRQRYGGMDMNGNEFYVFMSRRIRRIRRA